MTDDNLQFVNRSNEPTEDLHERSGRFFCRKGSWFFKTREAIDYGPFESRVECRYAYNEFIDVVSDSNDFPSDTFDYHDTNSNWQPPKINFS